MYAALLAASIRWRSRILSRARDSCIESLTRTQRFRNMQYNTTIAKQQQKISTIQYTIYICILDPFIYRSIRPTPSMSLFKSNPRCSMPSAQNNSTYVGKISWKSPAYTPSKPRDDDPVEYRATPPIYSPAWHPPSYYEKLRRTWG